MKVLFVCIHNTCRSIIAETIFNAIANHWKAESADIEKTIKIDDTAKRILEEKGFVVEKRKPRTINKVKLEDCDLVVAVCEECANIQSPNVTRWYIKNPVRRDKEVYKAVINEIEKKVKRLVEEIERDFK